MTTAPKMTEKIINAGDNKFLREFRKELPENCMLNKVLTGCGMTSVALKSKYNYVVAAPYISLIDDKYNWCKERNIDILAIHSEASRAEEISDFSGSKILVTYDSLGKVADALEQRGDLKDWKVLIDESHKLLDSASFRPHAIQSVLDNYNRFKAFTFGTATPVPDEYQLPELRHIQKYKIQWDNIEPVQVKYCHYDKDLNKVGAALAIQFLKGERTGNAHIFLNSVNGICEIINYMKRENSDISKQVRIVCADRDRNSSNIKIKLGKKYKISNIRSEVKKINFYTATAFEGCDIFDEEAQNIILADGGKDHTKVNITTIMPQIIGRVRNAKSKNTVEIIYTNNKYINISEKDFKKNVEEELKDADIAIKDFKKKGISRFMREAALTRAKSHRFISVVNETLIQNKHAWHNEMYNFSTHNETYYVSNTGKTRGISDGPKLSNSITYNYNSTERIEIKGLHKARLGLKHSFKDLCLEYLDLLGENISQKRIDINNVEPLIEKGFKILGEDRMKALKYRRYAIAKELKSKDMGSAIDSKIVMLLDYKIGTFVTNKQAKKDLKLAYEMLTITETPKATKLKSLYLVKADSEYQGGKKVAGYIIYGSKY